MISLSHFLCKFNLKQLTNPPDISSYEGLALHSSSFQSFHGRNSILIDWFDKIKFKENHSVSLLKGSLIASITQGGKMPESSFLV